MIELPEVEDELRVRGCLGSMGRVMVPRILNGQLDLEKLPAPLP